MTKRIYTKILAMIISVWWVTFLFSFYLSFLIYILKVFYSDNGSVVVKGMCNRTKFLGSFVVYDTQYLYECQISQIP